MKGKKKPRVVRGLGRALADDTRHDRRRDGGGRDGGISVLPCCVGWLRSLAGLPMPALWQPRIRLDAVTAWSVQSCLKTLLRPVPCGTGWQSDALNVIGDGALVAACPVP